MDSENDDDDNAWADQIDELARMIDSGNPEIWRTQAMLGTEETVRLVEFGQKAGADLLARYLTRQPDFIHNVGPVAAADMLAKALVAREVADLHPMDASIAEERLFAPVRSGCILAVGDHLKSGQD